MTNATSSSEESSPCSEVMFDEPMGTHEETPPPGLPDAIEHYDDGKHAVTRVIIRII